MSAHRWIVSLVNLSSREKNKIKIINFDFLFIFRILSDPFLNFFLFFLVCFSKGFNKIKL